MGSLRVLYYLIDVDCFVAGFESVRDISMPVMARAAAVCVSTLVLRTESKNDPAGSAMTMLF